MGLKKREMSGFFSFVYHMYNNTIIGDYQYWRNDFKGGLHSELRLSKENMKTRSVN